MNDLQEKILIIDDEEKWYDLLRRIIIKIKPTVKVIQAMNEEEGRKAIFKENPDLIFLDLRLYGSFTGATRLLRDAPMLYRGIPIVLISSYAHMETDLAKNLGAFDFIEKPPDKTRIRYIIHNALKQRYLENENIQLKREIIQTRDELQGHYENIIGESPAILRTLGGIDRCVNKDISVLIEGESGTGKELIAEALHSNSSRSSRRMVPVNCGAIPEALIESVFFGHKKGSFTSASSTTKGFFREANGSTMFLDEISELSLQAQVTLLRAIESGEIQPVGVDDQIPPVDVRIIAATNKDLKQAVQDGNFRDDLYYRLRVFSVEVPPLSQRKEDIPLLANFFAQKHGKEIMPEVIGCLTSSDWPGNIRQLENEIKFAATMADPSDKIQIRDLSLEIQELYSAQNLGIPSLNLTVDTLNIDYIKKLVCEKALELAGGNKTQAAKLVGVTRVGFDQMLKRYRIKYSKS